MLVIHDKHNLCCDILLHFLCFIKNAGRETKVSNVSKYQSHVQNKHDVSTKIISMALKEHNPGLLILFAKKALKFPLAHCFLDVHQMY